MTEKKILVYLSSQIRTIMQRPISKLYFCFLRLIPFGEKLKDFISISKVGL